MLRLALAHLHIYRYHHSAIWCDCTCFTKVDSRPLPALFWECPPIPERKEPWLANRRVHSFYFCFLFISCIGLLFFLCVCIWNVWYAYVQRLAGISMIAGTKGTMAAVFSYASFLSQRIPGTQLIYVIWRESFFPAPFHVFFFFLHLACWCFIHHRCLPRSVPIGVS